MKQHNNRKIGKLVIITAISLLALISIKGLAFGWSCDYDPAPREIVDPQIEVIDRYASDDGYYIFLPREESARSNKVVGFIHGYGALNPMIFGAWIRHLVDAGHIVIYPRYQKNLLVPSATEFTPNVSRALRSAIDQLREKDVIDEDFDLFLAGHSFGGVIASNIIGEMDRHALPVPSGVMVAEAGTGPLTGAMLDDYSTIPTEIPLVIIVGDNDLTVGDYFGRRLFSEARTSDCILIHQKSFVNDSVKITSSHYEPYSIDDWCDNGMENLTTRRARMVAKLDILDIEGYWRWLDLLIAGSDNVSILRNSLFDPGNPLSLKYGGEVLDGALEVSYSSRP